MSEIWPFSRFQNFRFKSQKLRNIKINALYNDNFHTLLLYNSHISLILAQNKKIRSLYSLKFLELNKRKWSYFFDLS